MTEQKKTTAMVPITISIDVQELLKSELGYTPTAARGGWDDGADDEDDDPGPQGKIIDIVAYKLAYAIQGDVKLAVREAVKEMALSKVDGLIESVLDEQIKLTNSIGEAKDAPALTLRESMIKAMTDRLEERVDNDGKKVTRDRYNSYDKGYSYLAWHANRAARLVLDKELMTQVNDAAKQIKENAKNTVAQKLAAVLGAAL